MATSLITTAKGKVEYSLLGQGKPLLFVHGGHVDCRETIFQKGLDPDRFCFIRPSRPGYGNTPITDLNKTPQGTADLFIAMLDELKIPKVTVIGISAGGLAALEIAAGYPGRVESMVLISALTKKWFLKTDKVYRGGKKLFAPSVERYTWLFYKLFFKVFPKLMAGVMFRALSTYRPVTFTKDELTELRQLTLNMRSGHGFYNDLDQTISPQILSRVECPTLILHSEYDNDVDLSHPQNARDNIRNAKLVTYPNRWGHLLWIGKDYEPVLSELKQLLADSGR